MEYLVKRGDRYYYSRRVPQLLREYDPRKRIRVALGTDSRQAALKLAIVQNDQLEAYWNELIQTGEKYAESRYKGLIKHARLLGFQYCTNSLFGTLPLDQVINRYLHVEKHKYNEKNVEAVLGGAAIPIIKLDDALQKFWNYTKDKLIHKTPQQIRKWENPRKKAMQNFISCVGNKGLHDLTRNDTLKFRDWWISRLNRENLVAASANKDLIHVKNIIETVNENEQLNLDTKHIFKKLVLDENDSKKRFPFDTDYIVSTLLDPENLKGLNEQAKWALHAVAETGAGLAELVGLRPEDILLDAEIPHININPRRKHLLKTPYRARLIPLVGFALDAFKACPHGFTEYYDRPDSLSSAIGKYLRENKLLPTDQHSVYSLRHSFQDRLTAANTPDRIQADLMGHKFNRPVYGLGATLAHKLEWLEKVQLKRIPEFSIPMLKHEHQFS